MKGPGIRRVEEICACVSLYSFGKDHIPIETMLETYRVRVTREVVGGLAGTKASLGNESKPAVVGLEDGELPSLGVLDLDIQLAVLTELGGGNAGAGLGDEAVEEDSDGGKVRRELSRDSSSRAARAGEGDGPDLDLMAGGAGGIVLRGGKIAGGNSGNEAGEERESEGLGETHIGCYGSDIGRAG